MLTIATTVSSMCNPCISGDNGLWTLRTLGVRFCFSVGNPLLTPFRYGVGMGENESVVSSSPESHLLITP